MLCMLHSVTCMTDVAYLDSKAVTGYSSQSSGIVRDHSWHTSSKQHSYSTSAGSGNQWSSRGTGASATVSARSDWSGRGNASSAVSGGGSSFVSAAKNVMGMIEPGRSGAAPTSSRATHDALYDAYKPVANSAARRY